MANEVLQDLQALADAAGVQMLVVGATARDMLIESLQGSPPSRKTYDVDIAVLVPDWDAYQRLVSQLPAPAPGAPEHRFLVLGVPVDVVPFGGVEGEDRSLTWPRGQSMTVLGFREALDAAVPLSVGARTPGGPEMTVKVASLPAQSVLKLLAFEDRWQKNPKDAIDFRELARAYLSPNQVEEVVYAEKNLHLLDLYDYDVVPVGAHVLGHEAAGLLGDLELGIVQQLVRGHLHSEDNSAFIQRMGGDPAANRLVVAAYLAGLEQTRSPSI